MRGNEDREREGVMEIRRKWEEEKAKCEEWREKDRVGEGR